MLQIANSYRVGFVVLLVWVIYPVTVPPTFTCAGASQPPSVQVQLLPPQSKAERRLKQGLHQFEQSNYAGALESFQQALRLFQRLADRPREGESFYQIGFVYRRLGQYPQALNAYQQSLMIWRGLGNRLEEGRTLNDIGLINIWTGKYAEAVTTLEQTLRIRREVSDRQGEGFTLINLGLVHSDQAQYPQALAYYQQALSILQELKTRRSEGTVLNNIGLVYSELGSYTQALTYYMRALPISKEVKDSSNEARILHNIGFVYERQQRYPEALRFYQQALVVRQIAQDRVGEARTLNNLGFIRAQLGQYRQAKTDLEQALTILHQVGDRSWEGITLASLGTVYKNQRRYAEALAYYQQALAIHQEVGDRTLERITLGDLAETLEKQGKTNLAIVFYKQSVNVTESIRRNLLSLPRQTQQSYTQTIADHYRALANLLLQQDRVLEAQQVLDLLKVQELDEFLHHVRGGGQPLIVLRPEEEILKKYNVLQQGAISIGKELADLENLARSGTQLSQAEEDRKTKLVQLREELNQEFNQFTRRQDVQDLLKQLTPTEIEARIPFDVLRGSGKKMAQLDAVLLYPLVLDDRLELLITAPNTQPLRRTVKGVGRKQLNEALLEFRKNLHPSRNPKPAAQKLYNWLIKPIEADLQKAKPTTIIYAPDGQLRYIPLAALYDGQQWLVQRYRINNITAKAIDDLTTRPQPQPHILAGAFGATKKSVTIAGHDLDFVGLSYTTIEVERLAKLLPNTRTMLDQDFTVQATTKQMNDYTIVHLATHAALVPEDASQSFILFRDGIATLEAIDNWTLDNVDLIVLSACETGLGGKFGKNGEEVLGLGYQFTKQDKARAAIASLWSVNDGGTQMLMNAFYEQLKQGNMTKAEALRQAQLVMIKANINTSGNGKRSSIEIEALNSGVAPDTVNHLSHPYYWAPFILIGNGL